MCYVCVLCFSEFSFLFVMSGTGSCTLVLCVLVIFGVIENEHLFTRLQINPDLSSVLVDKTRLLKWLLGRLKRRDFDANKQYASELLAILMQVRVCRTAIRVRHCTAMYHSNVARRSHTESGAAHRQARGPSPRASPYRQTAGHVHARLLFPLLVFGATGYNPS